MSKVASVASVVPVALVSVASVSRERGVSDRTRQLASDVGEWRQVGSALSSVLSRVRVVAEASAKFSSVEDSDRSRMH